MKGLKGNGSVVKKRAPELGDLCHDVWKLNMTFGSSKRIDIGSDDSTFTFN